MAAKKVIKLKPINLTYKIALELEKKGLIGLLKPTKKILGTKPNRGNLKVIYVSSPKCGAHQLLCIALDKCKIRLNCHNDNEEFIIMKDPAYKCKDLYLAIGLHKIKEFERRAAKGLISEKDVMLLKWKYNEPKTCIFTMFKETPHCEVVLPGGKLPAPYFFVTEPSKMTMPFLNLGKYRYEADI